MRTFCRTVAVMIDVEVEVHGPFATQPRLVKIGAFAAFISFLIFGIFIPTSLAVAVIGGVGQPAANWKGTAGALALTAVMAVIGAWVNCHFLLWLRSGVLSFRARVAFVLSSVLISTVLASAAAALEMWPAVFLTACVLVLIGVLSSWALTILGGAT